MKRLIFLRKKKTAYVRGCSSRVCNKTAGAGTQGVGAAQTEAELLVCGVNTVKCETHVRELEFSEATALNLLLTVEALLVLK